MRSKEEILAKYATMKKDRNEALNAGYLAISEVGFCAALKWLQERPRIEEEIRAKLQWANDRMENTAGILDDNYLSAYSVVLEWILEDAE